MNTTALTALLFVSTSSIVGCASTLGAPTDPSQPPVDVARPTGMAAVLRWRDAEAIQTLHLGQPALWQDAESSFVMATSASADGCESTVMVHFDTPELGAGQYPVGDHTWLVYEEQCDGEDPVTTWQARSGRITVDASSILIEDAQLAPTASDGALDRLTLSAAGGLPAREPRVTALASCTECG